MTTLKKAAKYPFLNASSVRASKYELTLDDLTGENKVILDYAVLRLKSAVTEGKIITTFPSDKIDLLSYPVAFMLVSYAEDRWLTSRWALAEAERVYEFLRKESSERLLSIAIDQFQWNIKEEKVEYDHIEYEYSIYFSDYITNAKEFSESKWKLVNRILVGGFLPITQHEFVRLLQNQIREYMESRLFMRRQLNVPVAIEVQVLDFMDWVAEVRPEYDTSPVDGNLDALPPCIRHILSKLKMSINLSHTERFNMVAFLLKIGLDIEQIIDLFKISPDFREDLTRAQVEQIAQRDYMPASCDTFRTHKICHAENNKMCGKSKNPLGYYQMKTWVLKQPKS